MKRYSWIKKTLGLAAALLLISQLLMAQARIDSIAQLENKVEELNEAIVELEEKKPALNWQDYVGVGALVTILGGLIGFYFKKSIDTSIHSKVAELERRLNSFEADAKQHIQNTKQDVINAINSDKTIFEKLRDAADLERILMKSKKIKIVGESPEDIVSFLTRVGFTRANLITVADEEPDRVDIYFINNESGTVDLKDEIKKVKQLAPETFIFHYTSKHGVFFLVSELDHAQRSRVSYATNYSQMLGNLLNLIKQHHRIMKQG